jgi:hypothetical protein
MSVQIKMPDAPQQPIGRRLFGMAAPIVGGIFGGPAGAAVGGVIGAKVAGASTQDALAGGLKNYAGGAITGAATPTATQAPAVPGLDESQKLSMPALGDSAMGRKLDASSQNPAVATQEGLDALPHLEAQGLINNDQRKHYTGVLLQTKNLASTRRY